MYGVAGEKRPIFYESDAFLYNLDDPNLDDVFPANHCYFNGVAERCRLKLDLRDTGIQPSHSAMVERHIR